MTNPPGSAVKRARYEPDESVESEKSKNSSHIRNMSSSSLSRGQASTRPATEQFKKPVSAASRKQPLSRRTASPETDIDDSMSVADSVISVGSIRRSEAQRLEYFKNEPFCGVLSKDSAECKRCGKNVRLGGRTTYRVRPWELHRAKCDQTVVLAKEGSDDAGEKSKHRAKTVEQRIASLTGDPDVASVKPHEVLCRNCGTWVRLSNNVPYKIANWKAHTQLSLHPISQRHLIMSRHQPSDRVAAATRKLRLVNDSQVKSFTDQNVLCAYCDTTIVSGEMKNQGQHDLDAWTEHKTICTHPPSASPMVMKAPVHQASASDVSTVPFPSRPPPSTASVASTEATLIATENSPDLMVQRTKRPREDEGPTGTSDQSDCRPTNRVRTETPQESTSEPNTVGGWLAMPIQAFIRGFKESLSG
ncbi:hypothetical protein H0H93_010378 [Arthromyces matolae]|nr:hypothetical protein H0H93_010378 [Arthromyces matolae]